MKLLLNKDIYPEFEDAPYQVYFANVPALYPWLKLENNQLSSSEVPLDAPEELILPVLVSNVPGGESKPKYLKILVSH